MINNLQALYKADFKHLSETVIRDLEATEEIQQLRRDIKKQVPGSNWTLIRLELLIELEKLLDIKFQPILIESWKTHQDVSREIAAQEQSDDDVRAIVNLEEHEIRSSHSPSLNITIGESIYPMRTFIGITLQLSDVSLLIQQGKITKILSGTVKGKGFMQYQNATLIEKDFLDFDITGKVINDDATTVATMTDDVFTQPIETDKPQIGSNTEPSTVLASESLSQSAPQRPTSVSSNMLQFIIGISIALIAVYLFWQFK